MKVKREMTLIEYINNLYLSKIDSHCIDRPMYVWLPTLLYLDKKVKFQNCMLSKYKVFIRDYLSRDIRYLVLNQDHSFRIYHNLFGYRYYTNCILYNYNMISII